MPHLAKLLILALALVAPGAGAADDDDGGTSDDSTREEQNEEQARARRERAEPRPPLPEVPIPDAPKWERRLEIGGDFAWVMRPFSQGVVASRTRYQSAPGWGFHLRWAVLPWLSFRPYLVNARHDLVIPQGALATGDPSSISAAATITSDAVGTFAFGAKLAPTWQFSQRARGWLAAGLGWGRFEFPRMSATEPSGATFDIRERTAVFVEVPIAVGLSFDILPRWLAVEYELSAAPVFGQSGKAHETFQAIDADGNLRHVAGFGAIQASFVQTLGLSLVL